LPDDVAAQDGGDSVPSVISVFGDKFKSTPSKSKEFLTKLVTSLGSTEQRQKDIELMEMDVTLRQKEIEDKQILREQDKQ
jgi:hypothetical protein